VMVRAGTRAMYRELLQGPSRRDGAIATTAPLRRVILIGADRFASIAIALTDSQPTRTTQVVAALDARSDYMGRKLSGVPIVGEPLEIGAIADEYAVHGVDIDQVWLSEDEAALPRSLIDGVAVQCEARDLVCVHISDALNLSTPGSPPQLPRASDEAGATFDAPSYFKFKRAFDLVAASALLIASLPLALCVAYAILFDVGAPALFWQQRIGRDGRRFLLYKFRTYRAPFDAQGAVVPVDARLSKIGRAIRASRLDELPQLFNVLSGDMSLIGPRPLLLCDQPADPSRRLRVWPGITGWAQINGGNFVTAEEKNALDVWYIHHASFWLDVKIVIATLRVAITGEKLNQEAVDQALCWCRHESLAAAADAAQRRDGDNALDARLAPDVAQ
jgi:lipopolysaccharide/colanic/teichoic acid biosynthesis glycosyltransferase